jgi:nitroreductase
MDTLTAIHSRVTAAKLSAPAPSAEQLQKIFEAAARAPDHGRIAPWHFIVIEGDARERFGALLGDAARRQKPGIDEAGVQSARNKALRAPLIVVAVARVVAHPKVPEIEQLLAVGAAVQNALLAAEAMGFGSMWKTGAPAYDPEVKRALGLQPTDHIIGFLYFGTPVSQVPVRPPELQGRVARW